MGVVITRDGRGAAAGDEPYPHLYGPLNLAAVDAWIPLPRFEPGGFVMPDLPPCAR